jgi:hypothetical protein
VSITIEPEARESQVPTLPERDTTNLRGTASPSERSRRCHASSLARRRACDLSPARGSSTSSARWSSSAAASSGASHRRTPRSMSAASDFTLASRSRRIARAISGLKRGASSPRVSGKCHASRGVTNVWASGESEPCMGTQEVFCSAAASGLGQLTLPVTPPRFAQRSVNGSGLHSARPATTSRAKRAFAVGPSSAWRLSHKRGLSARFKRVLRWRRTSWRVTGSSRG